MRDDDHLIKLCAREFETHVAKLFETNKLRAIVAGEEFAHAPYIGGDIGSTAGPEFSKSSALLSPRVDCSRNTNHPGRPLFQSALPIAMKYDESPRRNLVGYYGGSQAASEWDERHPYFSTTAAA
jgi:hypothetical protein